MILNSNVNNKIKISRRKINKKKRLTRSLGGDLVILIFLGFCGAFSILPLIYTVVNAFKPLNELFLFPPRFFVRHPTLDNFTTMIQLASNMWVPFSRYLFNSLFIAIFGTVAYVIIASLAAYPLAKHKFPGSALFFQIVVSAILFRPEVTGIPQYIIISKLGMVNTYFAILLPVFAGSFGVFLMRQFMVTFPTDTIEAAKIDGASEYKIFWSIVMPSVKPGWLTLGIFTFQGLWNTTGVQYIFNESMKVLPTVLSQIATAGIARAGAGSAVALFLMIPPIVFFVISQSSVIETMSHSGLK
jgi:ABC-type glycerol-3-phosphate transport system permease component